MSSFNEITIVGNLGRDPELTYSPQGTGILKFSVATNERRTVNGEKQETTTWFRVVIFGKSAEALSKFLAKGRKVYVSGRLSAEEWTDREGKNRTSLEVTASNVQVLDRAPEGAEGAEGTAPRAAGAAAGAASGGSRPAAGAKKGGGDIEDDEIPF